MVAWLMQGGVGGTDPMLVVHPVYHNYHQPVGERERERESHLTCRSSYDHYVDARS
jgi:hypothetical protein